MQHIRGAFYQRLRERPFDFYSVFVILVAGIYSFISPNWPENTKITQVHIVVDVISVYMILSSLLVISALFCNRKRTPVYAIAAEMWGWLAISAASFAVTLIYIAKLIYDGADDFILGVVLILIWFGMCLASGFRSLDIYVVFRGMK